MRDPAQYITMTSDISSEFTNSSSPVLTQLKLYYNLKLNDIILTNPNYQYVSTQNRQCMRQTNMHK